MTRTFQVVSDKTATVKALRAAGVIVTDGNSVHEYKNHNRREEILYLLQTGKLKVVEGWSKSDNLRHQREFYRFDSLYTQHSLRASALLEKRVAFAKQYAERYHLVLKSLYTSKRAYVISMQGEYISSMCDDIDREAYSKTYGFPARWRNAAVVIRGREFDIYTSRGTKVATVQIPSAKMLDRYSFDGSILLALDFYAIKQHAGIYIRYSRLGRRTGLAVQQQKADGTGYYYEHGETITQIRAEVAHKRELHNKKAAQVRNAKAVERAARLIKRLASNAVFASYQDARSVGYCDGGIRSFCSRHNMNPDGKYSIAELAKADQGSTYRLIDKVAQNAAAGVVAKVYGN